MKKTFRNHLTPIENRLLTDEIFVTVTVDGKDGDDSYLCTYDNREDAVDSGDHDGQLVATYKLVKVEYLALTRSTTTALTPVKK